MDGPAEFGELFFNVGERVGESGAAVRAGGAFGEDAFALQFERLAMTFLSGFIKIEGTGAGCGGVGG